MQLSPPRLPYMKLWGIGGKVDRGGKEKTGGRDTWALATRRRFTPLGLDRTATAQ